METSFFSSPIGLLRLTVVEHAITSLTFSETIEEVEHKQTLSPLLEETKIQLEEYFSHQRTSFSLPFAPQGTAFQQSVWNALTKIPYGETKSYEEIAIELNNPKACRGVGSANGKNPILLLIPCHRVITKSGALGGYRGGLDRKKFLLQLETGKMYI